MAKKMIKEKTKEVTITGYIEEIELEDGETGLQIDDGDDIYLVSMDKTGRGLQRHLDEEIKVTGVMTITAEKRELKVKAFHPANDDYYDDDDGYDEGDRGYYD